MTRAGAIFFVALAASSLGCGRGGPLTCDRTAEGNPVVRYTEGEVVGGVYMSSPWDGELLYFPGGMHFAIEHKLPVTPEWTVSYLAFESHPTNHAGLAQAAGNQVLILDADATTLTLANDSCVDYWLLVTAGTNVSGEPPP